MGSRRRGWALAEFWLAWTLLLGAFATCGALADGAYAQTAPAVTTTQITDTVHNADGTVAAGTVLISWPAFTDASGSSIPAGSTSVTLGSAGSLSVRLVPNAGSTPIGTYYTAVYHLGNGGVTREYWVVPASSGAVALGAIKSTVLPTSVAMQTVSKSYVDTAIAAAVTGHPLDSTPYVLKTGDTMTGPLTLPADPVSPNQASDKHYVDTQVAAVSSGLGQAVVMMPANTQTVSQPAGTEFAVNTLNGVRYASQYATGAGNNGIANATSGPDCAGGCTVVAEPNYNPTEVAQPATFNDKTHVEDLRGGATTENFINPQPANSGGFNAAKSINVISTESAQTALTQQGAQDQFSEGLAITSNALAGGSNNFPANVQGTVPYFKSTYQAMVMTGNNNTLGQHILYSGNQNCYGVGDCLMGGLFMQASGGFRDDADEGSHPFDLSFTEDARVFAGTCAQGCTTGSTALQIAPTAAGGTQGEGRFLLDINPAKSITTGAITGGSPFGRHASATFSGSNFPVSVFLETAAVVPSQVNNIAPGTVNVPIVTSGVPSGYAGNTAALPSSTGVACVSDAIAPDNRPNNFETAAYTVVDGSHLQLTLTRPHGSGATLAVGGLCGYGLEQKVDTVRGIRQVFLVIGSTSPTSLFYAAGSTPIVGAQGATSAYTNINLPIAALSRAGNVVSVTTAGGFPADLSGLTVTIAGVTDPSYNGNAVVTTTGQNSLTYANNGPDSTSTGGTVAIITGAFALYPMAETLSVYNTSTRAVDGAMLLAANTVPWASGDPVEQPHYFQEGVSADTEAITQYTPRSSLNTTAGLFYGGNNGSNLYGFEITNGTPVSNYFGNGGTHTAPHLGIAINGVWRHSMEMEAGEDAAINVHCNSHGCGKWNSAYDLFQMDTNNGVDRMHYSPATSTLTFYLSGHSYQFDPAAFTANTINVNTLNAASIHGAFEGTVGAQSLPVFGASGASHELGAVPDPGALAGSTRFLREDGVWTAPAGGTGGGSVVSSATVDATNSMVQSKSAVSTCAFGLHVHGDSFSVMGFGSANTAAWAPNLATDCGLAPDVVTAVGQSPTYTFAAGGNLEADTAVAVFAHENPADSGNPIVTEINVGGNNANLDPTDLVGFQQDAYAALTWPAISSSNKVVMGSASVSHTGTCAADNTFSYAHGLTCAAGAVLTWTASAGSQGVAYLYAKSRPTSTGSGTFAVSSGSTTLIDTITASSTINPYIPSTRWYNGGPNVAALCGGVTCGVIASRFGGLAAGQQTFHATVLSGTVTFLAFAAPAVNTNAQAASGPRVVMGNAPHRMNYEVDSTVLAFDALDLVVNQTLLADGLNLPFVDLLPAIDMANDYATSATTSPNCAASTNPGHGNSCWQTHVKNKIEAALGITTPVPNIFATSVTASGTLAATSITAGLNVQTGTSATPGGVSIFAATGTGLTIQGTAGGAGIVNFISNANDVAFHGNQFDSYATFNLYAGGSLVGYHVINSDIGVLGTPAAGSFSVVDTPSYKVGGVSGFTGSKTTGSCTFTIVSGIITNVTGC